MVLPIRNEVRAVKSSSSRVLGLTGTSAGEREEKWRAISSDREGSSAGKSGEVVL